MIMPKRRLSPDNAAWMALGRVLDQVLFQGALDSEWDESKHPRADNGEFGEGNGDDGDEWEYEDEEEDEGNAEEDNDEWIPQKVVNNPKFKKWFGESKVTSWNGLPQVMYHGSDEKRDTIQPGHK
jgi:hypothetical protein